MDWTEYNEQVEALEKTAKDGARSNFELYGHVQPVALALATRNPQTGAKVPPTPIIVPLRIGSEEEKELTVSLLHEFVEAAEVTVLVMVTEIWMAVVVGAKREDLPFLARPSTRPDRKEALMVQVETLMGVRTWLASITRRPDGSGKLGLWKEEPGMAEGRMTGFIRPRPMGTA